MTRIQSTAPVLFSGPSTTPDSRPRLAWLAILIVAAIVVGLIVKYWTFLSHDIGGEVPAGFGITLAAMLSLLPLVLCIVQNVSRNRQLDKLDGLKNFPLAHTSLYETAKNSMGSLKLVVDADYTLPILTFLLVTFFGFLAIFVGYGRDPLFSTASVLLGGLQDQSNAKFSDYQLQTFCVVAMAFVGGYIYSINRIVARINTNDLFPISLHFYTIRIITASATAAVLRHTISALAPAVPWVSAKGVPLLLLLGFVIGLVPDMYIGAATRKVSQLLNAWGSREPPNEKMRPLSLPLWMIDDLTREKIDRLNELGIDSAQMLARQNPFILLPRLPYDLGLLVDWIGQAQLYELVKDENLRKLRASCVRDIFDFHVRLADDKAQGEVCKTLDLPTAAGHALLKQLNEDPSFLRLQQVRHAISKPIETR